MAREPGSKIVTSSQAAGAKRGGGIGGELGLGASRRSASVVGWSRTSSVNDRRKPSETGRLSSRIPGRRGRRESQLQAAGSIVRPQSRRARAREHREQEDRAARHAAILADLPPGVAHYQAFVISQR